MLGHDTRTPLTAALLAAEMLVRQPQSAEKSPERLHRVIQGMERLDTMIKNLLDADRLRTGQGHPIEVAFCDVSEIVAKVCGELTVVHGNRFVADLPQSLTGYWDGAALQRVLENLANNAVKYGSSTAKIPGAAETTGPAN